MFWSQTLEVHDRRLQLVAHISLLLAQSGCACLVSIVVKGRENTSYARVKQVQRFVVNFLPVVQNDQLRIFLQEGMLHSVSRGPPVDSITYLLSHQNLLDLLNFTPVGLSTEATNQTWPDHQIRLEQCRIDYLCALHELLRSQI